MSESSSAWPELPVAQWVDTRDALQLMTQVVGKVRLANTPLMNHWWNVVLYVSARGLTTGLIPYADKGFSIDFDFIDHHLIVSTTGGDRRTVALRPGPIADFYREVMGVLDELGLATEIWPMPVEIEGAIPFDTDKSHVAYDGDQVHRFWLALVQMNRVFEVFRSRFVGKVSPVHFFWGALDLAVTRFSGRTAPKHPGGAPNCGPHVMWEAYSHEVSSAGYWPGPDGEGVFYSYAYPEPPGYRDASVSPAPASFDEVWVNSRCPTPPYARPTTPTRCCSSSCRSPTTSPPTRAIGTAPRWNAVSDARAVTRIRCAPPTSARGVGRAPRLSWRM